MRRSYHSRQEYSFHRLLVEFAKVCDGHLCGGSALTFFAWTCFVGGALGVLLVVSMIAQGW